MAEQVVIERRFNGPPEFGQGGYSCGLVSEHLDTQVAAVSLRMPVPLETPLEVRRGPGGSVSLLDPAGAIVADGEPAELDIDPPPPPSLREAEQASARSPIRRHPKLHAFPTCFGCGVAREPSEAICIIPGPLTEGEMTPLAAAWTPLDEFAGPTGAVRTRFMWAALDCPTGWVAVPAGEPPHVLARMTARPLAAPVKPGEPHVVVAWLIGRDGRKSRGAAAIYGPDGELCGLAEGLWIRLRDPSSHGAAVS